MTHTTLRSEEMFDFCTQMSMILAGGLSVEEGLEIIGDDTENPHMKEAAGCLLVKVHRFLQRGAGRGSVFRHVCQENG